MLEWWNNKYAQAHYGFYFKRRRRMKRIIDVKFDFTKNAEIVDWNAEEIQEYRRVFKRDVVPEMAAIERRKIKAIELAYKIRCGTFCSMK